VRWRTVFVLLILSGFALWMGFFPVDWQNWLGFSHYAYFEGGQNYAFTSGPGPMLITAVGLSTIIAGAWHHINCHVDGCMMIGRYPLAGGQYKVCRRHHPDDKVRRKGLTLHHIHEAHRAHAGES
jgi:hypothetical protein